MSFQLKSMDADQTSQSAPTLATLGAVTNVTQTQSAVTARKGDTMDEDAFTKGSYKHFSIRYRQEQGLRGRVLVLREKKSLSFRRLQETGTTTGRGRGVRRSARSNKKELKINRHKYGKTSHMSKDCRSKETSAFEVGEDGLAETGCIEMASIQFLMFGKSAVVRKRSKNSFWDRFVCWSDCVPEDSGRRLPDAPDGKQC